MPERKPQIYGFDDFRLDVANRQLLRGGQSVPLASKAFDMLVVLVENGGRLLEKDELFSRVWPEQVVEESNLAVHVSAIRKALGDSRQNPHYLFTVAGHGYRFAGDVLRVDEEEEELVIERHSVSRLTIEMENDQAKAGAAPGHVQRAAAETFSAAALLTGEAAAAERKTSSAEYLAGKIKRHRRGAAIVVATLAVAIAAGTYFFYLTSGSKTEINSIAVLPFTNIGADPDAEYLSDGLTENIINSLSQLRTLRVIARSSVFRYKGRETDPLAAGRELGVRAVLTGRVTQRGNDLTISVELIDVRDEKQIWGEQYNRKFSDLLAVQSTMSKEISEKLRAQLTAAEQRQVTKRYTDNTIAYQLYLKGRYTWNKTTEEGLKKSIAFFNQAIEQDPSYALAYSGLADTYTSLDWYGVLSTKEANPLAMAAAAKALTIDDTLAEAHASLAMANQYGWDWAGAEKEYRRAIDLNPNYAPAHQWYGMYLAFTGRFDEGSAQMKRAQEIDPLSLAINAQAGFIFYLARRYDEAIEQGRRTLELEPNHVEARIFLAWAYMQKGMQQEAIAEFQKLDVNENPELLAMLGHAYAVSGQSDKARDVLTKLKESPRQHYVSPIYVAALYTSLGAKDQAFAQLEKAYEDRDETFVGLKVLPFLDPLHDDPRFAALVRRLGLPQ